MDELAALTEAIDTLVERDPMCLADAETVVALSAQLARLEAVLCAASAAFDAGGEWARDGARNAVAWLTVATRLPKPLVRRRVSLGRALGELPVTEAAWRAGEVAEAHVAAIVRARRDETKEALGRDEAELVSHARSLRFADFSRVLSYWSHHVDPDGAEADAEAKYRDRDAYLASSFEGMWFGQLRLDPIAGAIVHSELEAIKEELFSADWNEARARLGRDPSLTDLRRDGPQRFADAFVVMAMRSASAEPGARVPRPLFTVLVGEANLARMCELAQGMALTPGSTVPWLEWADWERVVFESPTRAEVSEKARFFTGANRRHVMVRDRHCTHPFCDQPAEICEVDHIVPYAAGGLTTLDNGRLLCAFHNRLRNQRPPPPGS